MSRVCKILQYIITLPLILELLIRLGIYQGVDYSNTLPYVTAYRILLFLSSLIGYLLAVVFLTFLMLDILYIYLSIAYPSTIEVVFCHTEFLISKRAKESLNISFSTALKNYFYESMSLIALFILLFYLTMTNFIADGILQLYLLFAI
jgi:hypothetical protein